MSDENHNEGKALYAGANAGVRAWFVRQWEIWPQRADHSCTTNISFLHGGVAAFREEHGHDPKMSRDFLSHVVWLDRQADRR